VSTSRAECDGIIRPVGASESAALIIVSVGISIGTLLLENLRVVRRWTCFCGVVRSSAAISIFLKSLASTLASDDVAIGPFDLKLRRAHRVNVLRAT